MHVEIIVLLLLAAVFVVLKLLQGDVERRRRLDRQHRLLRDKAATGGFSERKKWDEFAEEHGNYLPSGEAEENQCDIELDDQYEVKDGDGDASELQK